MNVHRAQEILAADEKIDVDLNGMAVWIDSVDSGKGLVKVHAEGNPADARVVQLGSLKRYTKGPHGQNKPSLIAESGRAFPFSSLLTGCCHLLARTIIEAARVRGRKG